LVPNYYKILGISANATEEQIKLAFRELAKKYHPDVNKSPKAIAMFQQIGAAYETLIDANKRDRYNVLLNYGVSYTPESQAKKPRHRDPRYRPKSATETFYRNTKRKPEKKDSKIILFENFLFATMVFIGLSALTFAIMDLTAENFNEREKGIRGLVFSVLFLTLLIYGWTRFIRPPSHNS